MKLSDMINDSTIKASIVEECTQLIDVQVTNKGGVSGVALKTAYRVVKGIGPGYVTGAIGRILPEACVALDPIWCEGLEAGDPADYLAQNPSRTADILLSVTDARAARASGVIAGVYQKFRKSVKGDIEAAIPDFAGILGQHLQTTRSA